LKLKVFTFRFSESVGGFDDKALQEFTADKEVIEFAEHFFIHENTPYLTVLIAYHLLAAEEKRKLYRRQDPRSELDDREKKVYDALRAWRSVRARQDGIPAYMIATNKQFAQMIKLRATDRAALSRVQGIGEAKIDNYGAEILQVLAQTLVTEPAEEHTSDKESEP
jgi:superfamily II DNA helicase RecQ